MLTSTPKRPWNSATKSSKKLEPFSPLPAPQSTKKRTSSTTKSKVARPVLAPPPVQTPVVHFKSKSEIIQEYTSLIETKNHSDVEVRSTLKKLRFLVYKHGIPSVQTRHGTLRSCIWKLFLNVYKIDSIEYISLLSKGPTTYSDKISNDVFRTLATDKDFKSQVTNEMLTRVLTAFVSKTSCHKSRLVNLSFSYVQGMNVLLAPFLYVMPELDAYYAFSNFILQSCPLYVQVNLHF
jgi:cell cycle arrest protein BUB2